MVVGGSLTVGGYTSYWVSPSGTYTLSGGLLSASGDTVNAGGTFVQTGGTNNNICYSGGGYYYDGCR